MLDSVEDVASRWDEIAYKQCDFIGVRRYLP